jgi:hypothetical protein
MSVTFASSTAKGTTSKPKNCFVLMPVSVAACRLDL